MKSIEQLQTIVNAGNVESLDDDELIRLARTLRAPTLEPHCKQWAEFVAVPVIGELAARLQRTVSPLRLMKPRVDRLERVAKLLLEAVELDEVGTALSLNAEDRQALDDVIDF